MADTPGSARPQVTELLARARSGEEAAMDDLLSHVYDELRDMARARLRSERAGHTLQATALVHEVYLRMSRDEPAWDNRGHFFCAAAESMRRVLVDHARRKGALRRGGDRARVPIEGLELPAAGEGVDEIDFNEALEALREHNARVADVVLLRHYLGTTIPETAGILEVGERSVGDYWAYGRAWLRRRMKSYGGDTTTEVDEDSG